MPLLRAQGRKAVLTAHGETLLRRARPLLQELSTLEELAGSLQRGWESQLKLVVDLAFPRERLLRIVAELGATCPHTQLQLADAVLSGAEEAITGRSADVVVTSRVPPGYLGDFLLEVPFIAVAHPHHALLQLQRPLDGIGPGASHPGGRARFRTAASRGMKAGWVPSAASR